MSRASGQGAVEIVEFDDNQVVAVADGSQSLTQPGPVAVGISPWSV